MNSAKNIGNNKAHLKTLLKLIKEVTEIDGNEWFIIELSKTLDSDSSSIVHSKLDNIRYLLEIKAELSIDYSYIKNAAVKNQLEIDNLKMENVRFDLKEKDDFKSFYNFCLYCFLQIENLLNYYYHTKYNNIDLLVKHLEAISKYTKKDYHKNISDIPISTKIFSFSTSYLPPKYGAELNTLRLIRNFGFHRCDVIKNNATSDKKVDSIKHFLQTQTYDTVRNIIQLVSSIIDAELE